MFYWFMKNIVVGPIALDRLPAVGRRPREHPEERRASSSRSNHLSFIDSVFLPLVVDRRIVFLAKSEYFTGKGLKGWATKLFFHGDRPAADRPLGRQGVRGVARHRAPGARRAASVLGIYPEGTRSPDGKLYRGRTGVARMVLEADVPVIPVAMIDTEKVMPIGTKLPEGAPHRHHHRRAARLLPLRGHRGRPLRPALGHRRDHVRAAPSSAARSTSTSMRVRVKEQRGSRSALGSSLPAAADRQAARLPAASAPPNPSQELPVVDPSETVVQADPAVIAGLDYWRDAAHQAAAGLAGRRGRRRGVRRDRDAAAARVRRRGRHPARAACRAPRAARRSCCRAATAPRPSPARPPTRSATG